MKKSNFSEEQIAYAHVRAMRDSRFMAAPCGGLSPWLSHRSDSTTSEEPPLSNFNSYWDIPQRGLRRTFDEK